MTLEKVASRLAPASFGAELDRLRFRRQFVIANERLADLPDWEHAAVGPLHVHAHPDLPLESMETGGRQLVLLGSIFDPFHPEKTNRDIVQQILADTPSPGGAFLATKRYFGNYALLVRAGDQCLIFQDARSLREIYFVKAANRLVCASQPTSLRAFASPALQPRKDAEAQEFFDREMVNAQWVGDETLLEGVYHLLPGQYLDLNARCVHRYWPNTPMESRSLNEALDLGCQYLQGAIKSIVHRQSAMMAITAGIDSRLLLAASRDVSDRLYYFVNQERDLSDQSPDIAIPKRIFQDLGLPFNVHKVPDAVDPEFRKAFLSNTAFASDRILRTIYNVYFKEHTDKINILGLGEVGRNRYGSEPRQLDGFALAYALGYKTSRYAVRQCAEWLKHTLPVARQYGINIMSLLYLEQRAGNWGAVGNSESDIAFEEIDPFDSHFLVEVLLRVDQKVAKYSNSILYREMVSRMWPELLRFPVNPPETLRERGMSLVKRLGVYSVLKQWECSLHRRRFGRTLSSGKDPLAQEMHNGGQHVEKS